MIHITKNFSLKLMQLIVGIFLVISILVLGSIGFMLQYQDLSETYRMAEETTSFIKVECQKFDNYTRGNSAHALQDLLDSANGLKKFISGSSLTDPAFLDTFIRTEHIGGVLILDRQLSPIAQADINHQDAFALWQDVISNNRLKNILQYPGKSLIDHVTLEQLPYDMAAVADNDGNFLILCYSCTEKPISDPYELTINSILTNNIFYKNPTLVITDGTQVLSSNSPDLMRAEASSEALPALTLHWKDGQFTRFRYGNTTYYGLRRAYNHHFIYAVYTSENIFTHRLSFIAFGFIIYMAIGILILAVQRHFDKVSLNKMEKQLHTIQAISSAYDSTFLLHINPMEAEAIRSSARLQKLFEKNQNPYDFLFAICKQEVAPEYHPILMHFLDLDTIAERLKGKSFLGCEVKDRNGTWYSVLLIPQQCDVDGNVLALLVTTRDITSVKQTEELSFKDQLTGLYNRNYLETRSKKFIGTGDYPVSLIMADCNYLKQTNDSLGHEYGDLLLQRIANAITEVIPPACVAMRIGGDEFLILCPQCDNEKAQQIVAEIRQKLNARSDAKLRLSAAFGTFTAENETISFEEAYKNADREMYRDKQASRIKR